MLRFTPIENARQAESYYSKSDGGYYLQAHDLHQEWGGKGAEMLGLTGPPDYEQFKRLIHGLDPHTGEQLTALLTDDRVPGWDVTASVPKGVTSALERGDERVREVIWNCGRRVLSELEEMATTRVRKGGRQEDRLTGNILYYAKEDPETRPTKEDNMPDWDRHIHFVIMNETFDPIEQEWKALKFRPIMDLRKWFSTRFDMYLASGVADLGYETEIKYKEDDKGGRKYYTWDIKGIPESVIKKNSRRSEEVKDAEKEVLEELKAKIEKQNQEKGTNELVPETLSTVARDKLGATSREYKRKDLTLDDYREYWNGRITPEEGRQIAQTIERARKGLNPKPENNADPGMQYAIGHHFYRQSVYGYKPLLITAMERAMGRALPVDIVKAAERQGVLQGSIWRDGKELPGYATTEPVYAQEQRITGFAQAGRGKFAPLADGQPVDPKVLAGLSGDQRVMVGHVRQSQDQVVLVYGGAGTGKTHALKIAFDFALKVALQGIGRPLAMLAPSADASRDVLRRDGFSEANTVAKFLRDKPWQASIRDGVIGVDEASLLPIDDLEKLCDVAREQNARLVLIGDPNQHKAVARHGNMLTVLHQYGGLPVVELKEIQRQRGAYAEGVAAVRDQAWEKADGIFRKLGWVVEGRGHGKLIEEYAKALKERKQVKVDGEWQDVPKTIIVVDPTHKDGDRLGEALRELRKAEGLIEAEDKTFPRLVALSWSPPEKGDRERYTGDEIVQFFHNTGPFKAGQRVKASELLPKLDRVNPKHFQVYAEASLPLAKGDTIRITVGGRTKDGHEVDNGRIDTIAGFTEGGDPILANGWVLGKDFGHLKNGLVRTSVSVQSKTDDMVLAAMNRASLGAMGAEQAYVTASRGRERGMIFTDMPREELLRAMQKKDVRISATELMAPRAAKPKPGLREKAQTFIEQMRERYRRLRTWAVGGIKAATLQPERSLRHGYAH
jgi:conjugative relaxase-like TrwC/TraI family protein